MIKNPLRCKYVKLAALSLLVISGCSSETRSISSDLAEEVAVDTAGLRTSDVSNLTSAENSDGKGYLVTFDIDDGTYEIEVNSEGIVTSFNFTTQKTGENESEDTSKEVSKDTEGDDSKVSNEEENEVTDGNENNSDLIDKVASHLGIIDYSDSDFTILETDDPDIKEVKVYLVGYGTAVVRINSQTFEIISTTFE